ncbi:hypothetical protein [Methanonatronarchaeum thermophilum]|uniref:hypothetical protein n=1 Tax=Methanonatronarchaeum thermophilum TaxID=1927129 RepID=UPI001F1EA818|nr:hypothetical protein [Methanonatronarchaeum thermophilum]
MVTAAPDSFERFPHLINGLERKASLSSKPNLIKMFAPTTPKIINGTILVKSTTIRSINGPNNQSIKTQQNLELNTKSFLPKKLTSLRELIYNLEFILRTSEIFN